MQNLSPYLFSANLFLKPDILYSCVEFESHCNFHSQALPCGVHHFALWRRPCKLMALSAFPWECFWLNITPGVLGNQLLLRSFSLILCKMISNLSPGAVPESGWRGQPWKKEGKKYWEWIVDLEFYTTTQIRRHDEMWNYWGGIWTACVGGGPQTPKVKIGSKSLYSGPQYGPTDLRCFLIWKLFVIFGVLCFQQSCLSFDVCRRGSRIWVRGAEKFWPPPWGPEPKICSK